MKTATTKTSMITTNTRSITNRNEKLSIPIRMGMTIIWFLPLLLLLLQETNAFLLLPSTPPPTFSTKIKFATTTTRTTTTRTTHSKFPLGASRSICTFEPADFALPTGEWPYTQADLNRLDSSNDSFFYDQPRFVTHIDDPAIESLTAYYREEIAAMSQQKSKANAEAKAKVDILDLCSSWISHLPTEDSCPLGRVAGVGMNQEELSANPQLTEFYRQDLNENQNQSQNDDDPTSSSPLSTLFADESFDLVTNALSVDYLTDPLTIFQEMHRILRPGGAALISFSNRCFPSKAVAMWLQADDLERLAIVGSYFHYSAEWESIEALDVKIGSGLEAPARPSMGEIWKDPAKAFAWASTAAAVAKTNAGDPIFVVKAVKK